MVKKRVHNIKKEVLRYIRELEKDIHVEKAILYGSYVKGTERNYSDIDLAIVSSDFEGGSERDYWLLGMAAWKINPLIEARPYLPRDLHNVRSDDFLSEIITTGKIVYLSHQSRKAA